MLRGVVVEGGTSARRGRGAPRPRSVLVALLVALVTSLAGSAHADDEELDVAVSAEAAAAEPPPEVGAATSSPATKTRVRYTLEGIDLRGNARTSERVILRFVPYRPGDVLDVDDPELEVTRFRLLATGYFSSVVLSLRRGSKRGRAILVVELVERNTIVVENLAMGIAADEDQDGNSEPISPFLGIQMAETNLAGTGITLGAGFAAASDQFAINARFFDPAFLGSDWTVQANLIYADGRDFFGNREVSFESPLLEQQKVTDYAVVDYRRFGGSIGVGYDLSLATRILVSYQLEGVDAVVPTVASHFRGDTREPIDFDIHPGVSVLSKLNASLVYDTRDAPFLPRKGQLATLRAGFAVAPIGSSYGYGKLELGYAHWWTVPWGHVISLEGQVGAIAGDAPFFEKFYVGDYTDLLPDRILGLNPDRRQPPNLLDTDIVEVRYGDYAAKLEAEYRIPLYSGRDSVYGIDFFTGAGLYGVATRRDFTNPPSGYEGFSLAPLDLTYNLGLRFETYVGGFSVAFSNLFGLLPGRGGNRK